MKMNGKQELLAQIARRGFVLVALLAMALICSTSGRAQSSATTASAQDAKAVVAPGASVQTPASIAKPLETQMKSPALPEEKPRAKGAKEGIVVHGHWTIEVKNPDGKVAAHQDFENTLDPIEGADLLTGLLSGEYVTDGFYIDLSSAKDTICGDTDCGIYDSRVPALCSGGKLTNGLPCGTLTYAAKTGTANNNAIGYTLSGAVTLLLTDGGTINTVGTGIIACLPTASEVHVTNPSTRNGGTTNLSGVANAAATNAFMTVPPGQYSPGTACFQDTGGIQGLSFLLTSRTISQPVTGGQSVSVTVVITFSGS
jgi:hypothetical protein